MTDLQSFAEDVKQLCEDYSSRDGNVYIKDVQAALDALLARYVTTVPTLLGEIWMAFGPTDDGRLIALPEYAAASERAVGSKIMDVARREGYQGLLADRLQALGWTIRRVTLADGVTGRQEKTGEPNGS